MIFELKGRGVEKIQDVNFPDENLDRVRAIIKETVTLAAERLEEDYGNIFYYIDEWRAYYVHIFPTKEFFESLLGEKVEHKSNYGEVSLYRKDGSVILVDSEDGALIRESGINVGGEKDRFTGIMGNLGISEEEWRDIIQRLDDEGVEKAKFYPKEGCLYIRLRD